ncbi:MAG: MATE family efflux transporter [Evtepia gabavorous]
MFPFEYGRQDPDRLRNGIFQSFLLIGGLTLLLNLTVYLALDGILVLLQIPPDILGLTKEYLQWIFAGMVATFLYNFFANLLRSVGDSATPLVFLGISVVLNIGLDILFVVPLGMGVLGAAMATVIAQFVAGLGLVSLHLVCLPRSAGPKTPPVLGPGRLEKPAESLPLPVCSSR